MFIALATAFEWMLAILGVVMAYRLLTGAIRLRGLLSSSPAQPVEPERVQALVVMLAGVAVYLADGLSLVGTGAKALPEAPDLLLEGVAGSLLLYLVGKLVRNQWKRGDAT